MLEVLTAFVAALASVAAMEKTAAAVVRGRTGAMRHFADLEMTAALEDGVVMEVVPEMEGTADAVGKVESVGM